MRHEFQDWISPSLPDIHWSVVPGEGVSYTEHQLSLVDRLLYAWSNLQVNFSKQQFGAIVAHPSVLSLIKDQPSFYAGEKEAGMGLGNLCGRWRVFTDCNSPNVPVNTLLVIQDKRSVRIVIDDLPTFYDKVLTPEEITGIYEKMLSATVNDLYPEEAWETKIKKDYAAYCELTACQNPNGKSNFVKPGTYVVGQDGKLTPISGMSGLQNWTWDPPTEVRAASSKSEGETVPYTTGGAVVQTPQTCDCGGLPLDHVPHGVHCRKP